MTKIKICGITNLEDAQLAVECGADALGFNFYLKSPRYIAPGAASDIIGKLGGAVKSVGVFVNDEIGELARIAVDSEIDEIQLHGDESPEYCERAWTRTSLNVIKAFRIYKDFDLDQISSYRVSSFLIDAFEPDSYGGSGHIADLETAKLIVEQNPRVYLAGGLSPENVADAIRAVRPYAVDVCSRIESAPGKKDEDKLRRFIAAVKETK